MNETKLFELLQNIEEKLEENNELLQDVSRKLSDIESEASSINSNTDYTYNVKNVAAEILDILERKLK